MKRIIVILTAVAMAATACAAAGTGGGEKNVSPKNKAAALFDGIEKQMVEKGGVYLYFHADSYKTSIDESPRIEKLAKTEKAGFFVINVENKTLKPVWDLYNITFVPTVIFLEKGAGLVEKFQGPKAVKALRAGRKKKPRNEHVKKITGNSEKGTATLLEFYAEWCSPCVEMMPMLEEAEEKSDEKLDVIRIHMDREPEMLALYSVDSPPSNIVIDTNGIPRLRTGSISSTQRLLKILEEMGVL